MGTGRRSSKVGGIVSRLKSTKMWIARTHLEAPKFPCFVDMYVNKQPGRIATWMLENSQLVRTVEEFTEFVVDETPHWVRTEVMYVAKDHLVVWSADENFFEIILPNTCKS